jgi:hypothetical protein
MDRRFVILGLWLLAIMPAWCQQKPASLWSRNTFDATALPPGVMELNTRWRARNGDNPEWSAADYDDNQWPAASLDKAEAAAIRPGWRWYRIRVALPAVHEPLALMIVGPEGSYEVYLDGTLVPGTSIRSRWHSYTSREHVIPLPAARKTVTIAIRVRFPDTDTQTYGLALSQVLLGPSDAIDARSRLAMEDRLVTWLPSAADVLATWLVGCVAILLFFLRRNSREYLYLGVYLVLSAISLTTFYGVLNGFVPNMWNGLGDPLGYPEMILMIEFTYVFLNRRVGRGWRAFEGILLGGIVCAALLNLGVLPASAYLLIEGAFNVPFVLVLPALLLIWFLRGNQDAGWLVLPTLATALSNVVIDLGLVGQVLGLSRLVQIAQPVAVGPLALNIQDIANFCYVLGITIVMAFRFTRVSRDQARSAAELDAAREVQQKLVPITMPATPGFQVEAAFRPAQEVGGDFYQVVEQPGGATLLVLGDVSGKGLKAAMTGVLAIGALRALAAEALGPAELLTRLNRELAGTDHDGFVTCLCVLAGQGGVLTVANAGHLAPYRNGEEIALDAGLPLSLTPLAAYAESTLTLAPGDQLTLLTDGVLEARNQAGELLGFDRTAQLSTQSAEAIAQAAQAFGQDDDITVLTLTFAGPEVNHA